MSIFFKILFSPILIIWWFVKLTIRILILPVAICWHILKAVAPEITQPLQGFANWLGDLFRLFK